jgi:Mn-containing catalase
MFFHDKRLQYNAGVRDILSFLIARDTVQQNQWLAAIADLETAGLETATGAGARDKQLT